MHNNECNRWLHWFFLFQKLRCISKGSLTYLFWVIWTQKHILDIKKFTVSISRYLVDSLFFPRLPNKFWESDVRVRDNRNISFLRSQIEFFWRIFLQKSLTISSWIIVFELLHSKIRSVIFIRARLLTKVHDYDCLTERHCFCKWR